MPSRSMKRKNNIKNRSMKKQCCEATYSGLQKWFVHMFEHLGWMLLARQRGRMDKIITYKNSLERLKIDIEERMRYMKDTDKKQDLAIMYRDLIVLIDHVKKDFP
jgi:hypothetical protein